MKMLIFTGAGVSKESGLSTFRDSDGLWENYSIEQVCTHTAIQRNRELVIDFYNQRRRDIMKAQPNQAHLDLAELQLRTGATIVTQNVDDLHERAAKEVSKFHSSRVPESNTHNSNGLWNSDSVGTCEPLTSSIIHLHGEIMKLRSSRDELATVELSKENTVDGNLWQQDLEARHADGSLLRPYIVFFGEGVPMMDIAISYAQEADILIVVGTSLAVYPAASLLQFVKETARIYVIDPGSPNFLQFPLSLQRRITHIQKPATTGVREFISAYPFDR